MHFAELISKNDPQNQFRVLVDSYKQIEYAWEREIDLSAIDIKKVKNIVVTGLGGSAIGGELLYNFCRDELNLPYIVNRNYELPHFVNEETLLIASSYSGNTEETISALQEGLSKKCQAICITTGGKIEEIAVKNSLPVAKLMPGFQPRYALWINFFTLLKILQTLKLIPEQDEVVEKAVVLLKQKGIELSIEGNGALKFAEGLVGYLPIIYAVTDYTSAVATRFKGQINENSKQHAFYSLYPELDHNEIMGWESYSEQSNFKLIYIYDDAYQKKKKKRIEITNSLIEKTGCEVVELKSELDDPKLRMLDVIYFADWISYYYAVIRNFDPITIDNINYLKEHL